MKKLWIENIDFPAKIYQEDSPGENFIDKSSDMIEWDNAKTILDWSRRRDMISPLFYAEAGMSLQYFSGLSIEKKMIGCRYFLIPYSIRIQLMSDDVDSSNWSFLLTETKKSREDCVEAMRKYTGQYIRTGILTLAQTQEFYRDVSEIVIWFSEANSPELKKWIFGLSPYETDFSSKDYYSLDMQNALIDIYNGNY